MVRVLVIIPQVEVIRRRLQSVRAPLYKEGPQGGPRVDPLPHEKGSEVMQTTMWYGSMENFSGNAKSTKPTNLKHDLA